MFNTGMGQKIVGAVNLELVIVAPWSIEGEGGGAPI